jgi:hypothetical protein
MQARLKPFKIDVVTDLEHREMLSSMLTLYGGLIFVQEDQSLQFLHVMMFIMVVIMNIRFWILWIFCVLCVYKRFHYIDILSNWMKRSFCIDVSEEDEDKM